MARILFYAGGSLPDERMPNLGADSRTVQVNRMLLDAGHQVVVSQDLTKYKVEGRLAEVPEETRALSHTLHPIPALFERVRPDIVYFAAFVPYLEPWVPPVPTVVEMGGPTLLEVAFVTNEIGPKLYGYFAGELNALAKADLVVVFGERQQWYYRIPLALAGYAVDRLPPVAVVPNAVEPSLIQPRAQPDQARFVYAGGIYPWTDPCDAIVAILDAIDERGRGEFHLIGGTNRDLPASTAMMKRIEDRMSRSRRAHRHPFAPYHELVDQLRTMSISVEAMRANCERDLAQPFRTPLALACGLPVMLADSMESAPIIREYDAGWTGPAGASDWVSAAAVQAIEDPQLVARKSANAMRLARERFSCGAVGGDLLTFLAHPTKRDAPLRRLDRQDLFTWWSPSERRLLLALRHPLLRPMRALAGRIFGRG